MLRLHFVAILLTIALTAGCGLTAATGPARTSQEECEGNRAAVWRAALSFCEVQRWTVPFAPLPRLSHRGGAGSADGPAPCQRASA